MSTQTPIAVRDYLARVRTALADLPVSEVDEILEDVRPHLTEIAEEIGAGAKIDAMIERLGSPESYAAELRAAGDYPASTEQPKATSVSRMGPRLSLWSLVGCVFSVALIGYWLGLELDGQPLSVLILIIPVLLLSAWYVWNRGIDQVAELPEIRQLSSALDSEKGNAETGLLHYLRSLQPALWLISALLLLVLGVLQLERDLPALLVLIAFVILAVLVIWVGLKVKKNPRLLWIGLPISALAFGGALGLVGHIVDSGYRDGGYTQSRYMNQTSNGQPGLFYGPDRVENVYVFDAEGKPLKDVYLYDTQGRPLTLSRYACTQGVGGKRVIGEDNKFPRPSFSEVPYDSRENLAPSCKQNDEIPFSAAIPRVPSPPSVSPAPPSTGASGSATPSSVPSSPPTTAPSAPPAAGGNGQPTG